MVIVVIAVFEEGMIMSNLFSFCRLFATETRKVTNFGIATALLLAGLIAIGNQSAQAQNVKYTKGSADQSLRGNFEVDPSTLSLGIQLPLGEYQGRGVSIQREGRCTGR